MVADLTNRTMGQVQRNEARWTLEFQAREGGRQERDRVKTGRETSVPENDHISPL
jgi:hypothetical protein